MSEKGSQAIRSVMRSFAILEEINAATSATITSLSTKTGLPMPTVFRLVRTLEEAGYIVRRPGDKRYYPTSRVQLLSSGYAGDNMLVECAQEVIADLTRELGWPILVLTRVGGSMVIQASTDRQTSLTFDSYKAGTSIPIFGSSAGHCYFVHASDDERTEMLEDAVFQKGRQGQYATVQLSDPLQVQAWREQGYITLDNLPSLGGGGRYGGISVPIPGKDRAIGVVSLLYFATAMSSEQASAAYADVLKRAGDEIAERMAAQGVSRTG